MVRPIGWGRFVRMFQKYELMQSTSSTAGSIALDRCRLRCSPKPGFFTRISSQLSPSSDAACRWLLSSIIGLELIWCEFLMMSVEDKSRRISVEIRIQPRFCAKACPSNGRFIIVAPRHWNKLGPLSACRSKIKHPASLLSCVPCTAWISCVCTQAQGKTPRSRDYLPATQPLTIAGC